MSEQAPIVEVKAELLEAIKALSTESREITLIGLCTTDGFDIMSFTADQLDLEKDKLAAMASSLCALSNSSSLQITDAGFDITTIESQQGNILFMRVNYLDHPCVVSLAAKPSLSLAQARFSIKRFASVVSKIR